MTDADLDALLAVQRRSSERAGKGLRRSWPEADALGRDGLRARLTDAHCAALAATRSDARAHATPIAFSLADRAFWIGSFEGRRLRNRATPWGSLALFDGNRGEHRALTVEGPLSIHAGEALTAVRARLDGEWVARHGHPPDWAAAMLELRPERVFSHCPRDA